MKSKIVRSFNSDQPLEEIISVAKEELMVKLGPTNITPKGRISVQDTLDRFNNEKNIVRRQSVEGFIKKIDNTVQVELSLVTKASKATVFIIIPIAIIILIGIPLAIVLILMILSKHYRTSRIIKRSINHIITDLE